MNPNYANDKRKINIEALLNPNSIAITSAASDPNKRPTGRPLHYLIEQGYKGKLFPVNPNYNEILGLKSYPDLMSIPDDVDLALILRPAKDTIDALKECAQHTDIITKLVSSGRAGGITIAGPSKGSDRNRLKSRPSYFG